MLDERTGLSLGLFTMIIGAVIGVGRWMFGIRQRDLDQIDRRIATAEKKLFQHDADVEARMIARQDIMQKSLEKTVGQFREDVMDRFDRLEKRMDK